MEAKHIVFAFLLVVGLPISIMVLRTDRRLQYAGMFMMVFSIPFVYSTGINFFPDKFYKGTARGFEVLATDMIAWSMAGVLISIWGFKQIKLLPAGSKLYFLYFAFCLISIANAASYLYAGYEVLKMIMIFIYFVTIYNCIIRYKTFSVILAAFGAIVIFNLFYMLFQRIAWGVYQPPGIFPHRNSAAMFANMVAPIFLSAILNAKLSKTEFRLFVFSFLCAAGVVVLALSRGAILFLPISTAVVVYKSIRLGINARKIKILAALGIIGLAGVLRAAPMIIDRFENAPKESGEGRLNFARAALNMSSDKFFGVGLNNWGLKINPPWTYYIDTGIKRPSEDFRSGIVETVYLLVAAECGWIGFASFILFIGYFNLQNYLNINRFKNAPAQYMPIGIMGGFVAIFGQSTLEWILKQPTNFYGMIILFAIVSAMTDSYMRQRVRNTRTSR